MARKSRKKGRANDGSQEPGSSTSLPLTEKHHRGAHKAYQNLLGEAQAQARTEAQQTLHYELEVGRAGLKRKLEEEAETGRAELKRKLGGE
ncbi:hypothetical protein CBOM_03460 [Ceraceosorus bombacis]|uniref:Uncharacterized protein n=1 Tax=Ceraceosorus bombacis TaxID=401625 RepID=A0A0P1BM97_9BASI|nr:hypothetical protein CBOM_03460 [Ceraceosorus bombacis]